MPPKIPLPPSPRRFAPAVLRSRRDDTERLSAGMARNTQQELPTAFYTAPSICLCVGCKPTYNERGKRTRPGPLAGKCLKCDAFQWYTFSAEVTPWGLAAGKTALYRRRGASSMTGRSLTAACRRQDGAEMTLLLSGTMPSAGMTRIGTCLFLRRHPSAHYCALEICGGTDG